MTNDEIAQWLVGKLYGIAAEDLNDLGFWKDIELVKIELDKAEARGRALAATKASHSEIKLRQLSQLRSIGAGYVEVLARDGSPGGCL